MRFSSRFAYWLAAALALQAGGAAANPQGGVVKAGSATITATDSRLDVVQSSSRAVIDWRSFSIGASEQVRFSQPSAAAATLNRVTGAEASAILGGLSANGTVFLLNPNGILIGPGAKIDVGGLIATTANISNENFMAGRLKFDQVVNRNAVIVNRGEITAAAGGLVALVAPGVENSGVIRAGLGRVVLASGNAFTLDLFGDKLVTFAIDDKVAARLTDVDGRPLKAYVNQAGTIEADGGSVLIAASAAKAVLDNVINTSGVVRATSFAERRGEIVLSGGEGDVRVAGTLDASGRSAGATGGSVTVLGSEVVLDPGSRINVSGDAGGGAARVGGPGTSRTTIAAGASVAADALARGDGGTIVAWSDGETRFAGALSARGGATGGDGGFVEVSGRGAPEFAGAVDLAGPAGRGGRLLLDAEFLVVDAATTTAVRNVLRSGAAVTLRAAETIDVVEAIDGRFGAKGGALTLDAGNAVALRNDLVTNDGPVLLKAGAGGITMHVVPATPITQGQGTVVHAGTASIRLEAAGDITAQHLVAGGEVSVKSTAGGTITLAGPIVAGANVTIGDRDRAGTTTIRLQNDIHTEKADIELNGTTFVNPRPGERGLDFLSTKLLLSHRDGTYYENPFVQVSVQTTGAGKIHFRGDVLYDELPPVNSVRYLWDFARPSATFDPTSKTAAAKLREGVDPRPTGYFGLNLGVQTGTVTIDGNLGNIKAGGCAVLATACLTNVQWPTGRDRLGAENPARGMWVAVHTTGGLRTTVKFGANSKVALSGLRVANANMPDIDFLSGNSLRPSLGLPSGNVMFLARSLPPLTNADGTDPGLIGPGPRNVLAAGTSDRLAALPELPITPASRPATASVATDPAARAAGLPARAADDAGQQTAAIAALRRAGPAAGDPRDGHEGVPPLVTFAGELAPGADPGYFAHGAASESVETRPSAPAR